MKTWMLLVIFISLWLLSIPSFGEIGWSESDNKMTGIMYHNYNHTLELMLKGKIVWTVPVNKECLAKEVSSHDLYMSLYCAEWNKIEYK